MEVTGVCRCCLAEGLHKDLKYPYVYLDKKEIYSDMLLECFNIVLMPTELCTDAICDVCITTLRKSRDFKQQVLNAEQNLLQIRKLDKNNVTDFKSDLDVKLEPKYDTDDSDDYFLADAVRRVSIENIKEESQEPIVKKSENKKKVKKKTKEDEWNNGDIKTFVSRLSKDCESPSPRKTVTKKRTITISKETPKITWSKHNHKYKQIDNLLNILKYSNVMPFKNKSLLGFICAYCDAAYPDPANLRSHTEENHQKDRTNLLRSRKRTDMTDYNVKLDITDLTCTLCNERIDNLTILQEHLVRIHSITIHRDVKDSLLQFKLKKGDVFDCAMCSSTYETFKMLKQHMNLHYGNFQCNQCDSAFSTKRSLAAHRTTHQEGSYKCEQCDKVFPSRSKKHYHVKIKHMGTRNISNCPFCNEPFRSYYQRNQHLIKVHNSEAQYKCNVCNRAFILKSLLMYHIKKNHLMERNAQCTECGYRFFSKKALKAHMVKHTGERNYACEVCHKTYARKYTLREHMRIHNNDRRFKCEVCGMTFVQKCSLKSHLLSNHGISLAASEISTS